MTDLTNLEFDGKIGLSIIAVYCAVTRRLGLDPPETNAPKRRLALACLRMPGACSSPSPIRPFQKSTGIQIDRARERETEIQITSKKRIRSVKHCNTFLHLLFPFSAFNFFFSFSSLMAIQWNRSTQYPLHLSFEHSALGNASE